MQTLLSLKKRLSFVLAVVMIFSFFAFPVAADDTTKYTAKLQFSADDNGEAALGTTISAGDSVFARLVTTSEVQFKIFAITLAYDKTKLTINQDDGDYISYDFKRLNMSEGFSDADTKWNVVKGATAENSDKTWAAGKSIFKLQFTAKSSLSSADLPNYFEFLNTNSDEVRAEYSYSECATYVGTTGERNQAIVYDGTFIICPALGVTVEADAKLYDTSTAAEIKDALTVKLYDAIGAETSVVNYDLLAKKTDTAALADTATPLAAGTNTLYVKTGDGVVSDAVTLTAEKDAVNSIAIATQPTKLSYTSGDKLDLTGLVVTATCSSDKTRTLDSTEYTTKIGDTTVSSDTALTVAAHNGKTVTVTLTADPTKTAATNALTVGKNLIDLPAVQSKVFNGSAQTADIAASGDYIVSANNGGTDAGTYNVVLTLTDPAETAWKKADGTADANAAAILEFVISKAAAPANVAATYNVYYGDTAERTVGAADFNLPDNAGEASVEALSTDAYSDNGALLSKHGTAFALNSGLPESKAGSSASWNVKITSKNYQDVTAAVTVNAVNVQFFVGSSPAAADDVLNVKSHAVYGDSWAKIATLKEGVTITAKVGNGETTSAYSVMLQTDSGLTALTGSPDAGSYTVAVVFNGEIDAKQYSNVVVATKSVAVAKSTDAVLGWNYPAELTYSGNAVTVGASDANLTYTNTGDGEVTVTFYLSDGTTKTTADNSGAAGDGAAPVWAGSYVASAVSADGTNYAAVTTPATVPFDIAKEAAPTCISAAISVYWGNTAAQSISAENFTGIPSDAGTVTLTAPAQDTVTGEILSSHSYSSFTLANTLTAADSGKEASFPVKIVSTNYADAEATVTVKAVNVEFKVGAAAATAANTLTIGANPTYGMTWGEIVSKSAAKIVASVNGTPTPDDEQSHYSLKLNADALDVTAYPDAGDYTVTLVYNGSIGEESFTDMEVAKAVITVAAKSAAVTWSTAELVYNGEEQAPTASITGAAHDGEITLTVTGKATNAGTGYTGTADFASDYAKKDNYTLTGAAKQFEIKAKDINSSAVIDPIANQGFTGAALTPALTVKDGETSLTADTDYSVEFSNNVNMGAATVTVTFQGNYSGSKTAAFTIVGKDLSTAATVELTAESVEYNGQEQTPAVTVKDGETALTAGTDYSVAYSNNKNVGTATVTVTFQGNYSGSKTATFAITKAARTISVTAPTMTWTENNTPAMILIPGAESGKIAVSVDKGEEEAVYQFKSGDDARVTVNAQGAVTAKANFDAVDITITTTDPNYTAKPVTVRVMSKIAPFADGISAQANDGSTVSASADGTTITLAGTVNDSTKITLKSGDQEILTVQKENDKWTDTMTYEVVGADKVSSPVTIPFTVNTVALVETLADVTIENFKPEFESLDTVSNADAQKANDAVSDSATKAEGVAAAAAAEVNALVDSKEEIALIKDAKALDSDKQTALDEMKENGDVEIIIDVGLKIQPTGITNSTFKLKLTPVYTISLAPKGGATDSKIAVQTGTVASIATPVTISLKLPDGFPAENLFVRHLNSDNSVKEILRPTVDNTVDNRVATWQQSSFSEVELFSDSRKGTVTFKFYDGSQQSVTYTAADLGKALPTDSRTGYTFGGWEIGDKTYAANAAVDDAFLTAIDGKMADAEPQFTVISTPPASYDSGTAAVKYGITVAASENGSVKAAVTTAAAGDVVRLTVTPAAGYRLDKLTVTDKDGNEIKTSPEANGCSFRMPASKVTVTASFTAADAVANPFEDVKESDYYFESVLWAVENGVTKGRSETAFAPQDTTTRAEAVTFLWNLANRPEPSSAENPFTDVAESAWYYKAVLWAVENGITKGATDSAFEPNSLVSRAEMVTFLWRAAGQEAPTVTAHPFTDAEEGAYYYDAMLWAVEHQITKGTTSTTFEPGAFCLRGQTVTFLYRQFGK